MVKWHGTPIPSGQVAHRQPPKIKKYKVKQADGTYKVVNQLIEQPPKIVETKVAMRRYKGKDYTALKRAEAQKPKDQVE